MTTSGLTPFLIGEIKTGLSTYLQPWQRPADAFEPLVNAYVYRGVLNKRNGMTVFGNQLADQNPVMGIMQRVDESTGAVSLVVASTTALYLYNSGSGDFNPLLLIGGMDSTFWAGTVPDGSGRIPATSGTIPTFWPNLTAGTVIVKAYSTAVPPVLLDQVTDNGSGGWGTPTTSDIFTGGGTIDYTTGFVYFDTDTSGAVSITLNITATLQTPAPSSYGYFTGNNTNFFNWTNWQPTDPTTFLSSVSYLYVTNNFDPVTLFDGTLLSRPIYYVNSGDTDYITNTLDVKVYKNRLLMILPTLNTTSNPLNQSIYYSALFNPFNFINDIAGNGGSLTAPSGDIIQSAEFLRDGVLLFFTNSTWIFRYTGYDINPYRFDKINNTKTNAVPYGTVAYDERSTSIGSTGFIACDGANVQRYDIQIIDYYETNISEQYYGQCYGQRYDNLNQAWVMYVSNGTTNPVVGTGAPGSDSAIIYNYLENSWATYTFPIPMTCMGIFFTQEGLIWEDATFSWESADLPWKSYSSQKFTPLLLGGDVNGNVYWMDDEEAVTDANAADPDVPFTILPNVTTTRWNPIIQLGQKVQFTYIDIYYEATSTDPSNPIQLTLTFFADNSSLQALKRTLTLDGPIGSAYAWKRIYINIIGEFLQMNIDPSEDASFQILGFILWAKPSGRLTP